MTAEIVAGEPWKKTSHQHVTHHLSGLMVSCFGLWKQISQTRIAQTLSTSAHTFLQETWKIIKNLVQEIIKELLLPVEARVFSLTSIY